MTPRLYAELAAFVLIVVAVGVITTKATRRDVIAAQQADSAAARAARRADTIFERVRVDTVKAVRTLRQYEFVRVTDTLVRVDTLLHDTVVYVPRAAADTAIRACTLARQTCGSALAAAQVALDSLTVARDDWRTIATRRPWIACGPGAAVGADLRAQLVVGCVLPLFSR